MIGFAKEEPELVEFINNEIGYRVFQTAMDAAERINGDVCFFGELFAGLGVEDFYVRDS